MKTILLSIALLLSAPVAAEELYTETSQQGESLDEFVIRIAPRAVAYTLKNRVEVCGMLAGTEGSYRIDIGTSNINNQCSMTKPADNVGLTFHTHPSATSFKFHDQDFKVPGYLGTVRGVRFQQGVGTERFVGRYAPRVSENLLSSR